MYYCYIYVKGGAQMSIKKLKAAYTAATGGKRVLIGSCYLEKVGSSVVLHKSRIHFYCYTIIDLIDLVKRGVVL